MAGREDVHDSPTGWVAKHIQEYVATGGEQGHIWNGVPTLLLTTRGRKSGKLRRSALIYGRDGESYVIVASIGGAPKHPSWYLNLVANPLVEIQVGPRTMTARARTANEAEKPALWDQMTKLFPRYIEYQNKTDRQIPVVILDPID